MPSRMKRYDEFYETLYAAVILQVKDGVGSPKNRMTRMRPSTILKNDRNLWV